MERFLLGPPIGEGRFGAVRSAVVKASGLPFAIKLINFSLLDEGFSHVVASELVCSALLNHPHAIRTHEVFSCVYSLALVMEVCVTDLSLLLADRAASNPFPARTAQLPSRMLLSALSYVHSERMLHRVVLPLNCFITKKGVLLLADCGLSRAQEDEEYMTRVVVSRWYRVPAAHLGDRHY
ncbi:protein kinase [Trypanosoma vivax]|nr:protein kinase [Trypanosoma vivax]